jgi:hypothetical protein
MTTNAVRRIAVTEYDHANDRLGTSNYAAAWEVAVAGASGRSAEIWARAIFEDAPRALRLFIVAGWICGLGLRLGPRPSPTHVLGWEIASRETDRIILSVRSVVLGTARFVLSVQESRIVLVSSVGYERPWAGVVWRIVTPLHHRIVPYLLAHAASPWPVVGDVTS